MVAFDRTRDFRELLSDAQRTQPEPKRRKVQKSSTDAFQDNQLALNRQYLSEGYAIVGLFIQCRSHASLSLGMYSLAI